MMQKNQMQLASKSGWESHKGQQTTSHNTLES